jgi:hypothetical protein
VFGCHRAAEKLGAVAPGVKLAVAVDEADKNEDVAIDCDRSPIAQPVCVPADGAIPPFRSAHRAERQAVAVPGAPSARDQEEWTNQWMRTLPLPSP